MPVPAHYIVSPPKVRLYSCSFIERPDSFGLAELKSARDGYVIKSPDEEYKRPVRKDPRTVFGWALKAFID